MSENMGNKKRPSSKKSPNGNRNGNKPKRPRTSSQKESGVDLKKKNPSAEKAADNASDRQIRIDEVMHDDAGSNAEKLYNKNTKRSDSGQIKKSSDYDEILRPDKPFSPLPDPNAMNEQISWKKQVGSIIMWMFSVILLALTFFPGESFWTVIHNFILGILGFKAFLWAILLVYFGYLLTKQKSEMDAMNIIRPTAGIIVLTDVMGYILVQSNGYRNVYNELTLEWYQLINQIFLDGSKVGGSGILGGGIGEIFMLIAGKTGAAIITSILLIGVIMVLSHTGPIELFEQAKNKFRVLSNPEKLKNVVKHYKSASTEKTVYDSGDNFTDDGTYPADYDSQSQGGAEASDAESGKANGGTGVSGTSEDGVLNDLVNKVSLRKKKKLTKSEEIKAESEEFTKQINSGDGSADSSADDNGEKEYLYPVVRLLVSQKTSGSSEDLRQELTETADRLIKTLDEYGVKASISDISRGPTVTRYEIKPAPGVKINKIKNLSADIALRLAAQSIRIEAPIPGKAAVGIEIPNLNKQMVRIREIIGSKEFMEAKGSLVVALGKDIEGNIVLCDLSKMPHLLIAGSTGSGKSVCVNSMLISMLYKYSPKEVRMVLIDPKSVEFDMYNGIPHLLVPVVCEPKKAAGALQWAVSEMLKRYAMLKERGVRNIDGYNRLAEQTNEFEKLCRIVIVIDEMADLMIASPKEVEDAIARLAAMARAAGMYMVLATQRPSVDVITGTIKNNIPSRIALAVSSQVDSRTILDEGGAENLIGYGDMLYHPMGSSKHIRVQGCFVEDFEVERVINYVKQNGLAEYDDTIADEIERNSLENSGESSSDFEGKDEFFEKAVEVVTEAGQASTSMLQRRLGVGYARAGRIIDQLEEHGIIGPHEGSKPRTVLISRAQWMEMTMSRSHAGKNDPLLRQNSEFASQTLDNGHEEITARQSEFFNADNSEDSDYEDEYEHELLALSDNSDNTEEDAASVDSEKLSVMPAQQEPVLEERTGEKAVRPRDLSIFLEEDTDDFFDVSTYDAVSVPEEKIDSEVDIPPWEDYFSAEDEVGKTETPAEKALAADDSFSDGIEYETSYEPFGFFVDQEVRNQTDTSSDAVDEEYTMFGKPDRLSSSGNRNMSATDDDDDFHLFGEPDYVLPASARNNTVEDDDDDLHAFSEPDRTPPARKNHSRQENGFFGDDEPDDDILSSPWIKKI